jgi:hypothetical protein
MSEVVRPLCRDVTMTRHCVFAVRNIRRRAIELGTTELAVQYLAILVLFLPVFGLCTFSRELAASTCALLHPQRCRRKKKKLADGRSGKKEEDEEEQG